MSKKISEVFDVEPVENSVSLPSVVPDDDGVNDDSEFARKNIREMISVGNRALENAYEVATQSESPRAYEVLSNMLKTMADINGQLLDMHEKQRRITKKTEDPKSASVTNNVAFIGTTNELNQLIMEKLKKS
jgi:hypothetical protein